MYEYWVTEKAWGCYDVNEQMRFLNEMSEEGWELVSIYCARGRFYLRKLRAQK